MTNPFDTNNLVPTWSNTGKILKGDFNGHPFHGNQWEQASQIRQDAHELATKAIQADAHVDNGDYEEAMKLHSDIEDGHRELAKALRGMVVNSTHDVYANKNAKLTAAADAHEKAADLHSEARGLHADEAGFVQQYDWESGPMYDPPTAGGEATWDADKASSDAAALTDTALKGL